MPRIVFEPKIPVPERDKTSRAFDGAATKICLGLKYCNDICLEGLRRTKKYLSQNNGSRSRFEPTHPKKKSEALPLKPVSPADTIAHVQTANCTALAKTSRVPKPV